jgi:phosphoglucomutase
MSQIISPLAGKQAPRSILVDVAKLLAAYTDLRPDPSLPAQRVVFGTSGHRGVSFERSFNEWHILAVTQAICDYRSQQKIDGPLFLGFDTHALSQVAFHTAMEVLSANGVEIRIAPDGEFTPTPVISHSILMFNRDRKSGLADGIVITPSHNPPDNGGFKYNAKNGGPADTDITQWVENRANELLTAALKGVRRVPLAEAQRAPTTRFYDFIGSYVADLGNIIDMDAIRGARIHMGVDPLGGAGVHYWPRIAEHYRLDLTVVSLAVDPQFAFMSVDWDGKIRMDPSSPYAMKRLIGIKDAYDISFACDTDHDRHGVVTRSAGLLPPNHYLSVLIDYLFKHRPEWGAHAGIGKTVVTTSLIDRVAKRLRRSLFEVPVGFKWFAGGLFDGTLGFGCEESAGASLLRRNGSVWTTDKDGLVPALLAAELTAVTGKGPGELYEIMTRDLGKPFADRVQAAATPKQKSALGRLSPAQVLIHELGGEKIEAVLDHATGNRAPIGGIKLITASGWVAARPSGTEDIYKIYGESFRSAEHLTEILKQAQNLVDAALAAH